MNGKNPLDNLIENKDNVQSMSPEELDRKLKGSFNDIAENTAALITSMAHQMDLEDTMRANLIKFLKIFLCIVTFAPLAVTIGLYLYKSNTQIGIALIGAVLNVPIQVLVIFNVIANKLFEDPYRKTVPEMISKVTEILTGYDVNRMER